MRMCLSTTGLSIYPLAFLSLHWPFCYPLAPLSIHWLCLPGAVPVAHPRQNAKNFVARANARSRQPFSCLFGPLLPFDFCSFSRLPARVGSLVHSGEAEGVAHTSISVRLCCWRGHNEDDRGERPSRPSIVACFSLSTASSTSDFISAPSSGTFSQ